MNRLATLATVCTLIAVVCSDSKVNPPVKNNANRLSPVRRMFEQAKQSDSPILRALSKMDQQPEPFDVYYPNYTPIPASMSPYSRAYYPDALYMDFVMQQWIREAQKKEMEQSAQLRNSGPIEGAIYIPALANGAFGGPISIVNSQGQQSQEELALVNGANSVESSPTSAECRSGLQDQRPYYSPQFRSSFYQPGPFYNQMEYYPLPYYPRLYDYYGYPF